MPNGRPPWLTWTGSSKSAFKGSSTTKALRVDDSCVSAKYAPIVEVIWRDIPGHEGRYSVSTAGEVRGPRGQILKPVRDKDGYGRVTLYRDGTQRIVFVSHLVLEAFDKPRPAGLIACHGSNGNGDDSFTNLSWGTYQKNQGADRERDGTRHLCGRKKALKPEQIELAKKLRADGRSFSSIGVELSVSKETSRKAVHGFGCY